MIKIRQSGFGLLEAILALGIMGIIMAGLMGMVNSYLNDTRNQIVANQSAQVMACTQQWISSNYSTVTAAATPIDTYSIPISSLITSGCLPTGFSTTNGFGQAYNIFALEPSASAVQVIMVTTGGTPINDVDAAAIASASKGGAVYSTAAGTLKGAMGNYAIPLAAFGIPPGVPGAGHVGWALWFGANGQIISDYIYRSAVPGHPEANRMNVALDMNGNNITAASGIVAGGVAVSGTMSASMLDGNLKVTAIAVEGNACPNGVADNGAIRANANGLLLSCQSGVWNKAQGSGGIITQSEIQATFAGHTTIAHPDNYGINTAEYTSGGLLYVYDRGSFVWRNCNYTSNGTCTVSQYSPACGPSTVTYTVGVAGLSWIASCPATTFPQPIPWLN